MYAGREFCITRLCIVHPDEPGLITFVRIGPTNTMRVSHETRECIDNVRDNTIVREKLLSVIVTYGL